MPHRILAALGREIYRVANGSTHEHRNLRRRVMTLLLASAIVDVLGTAFMRWWEFSSLFKAFFWVTTQLTTISSQLPNPTTTQGRVLDMFLQLWALVVVTTLAGSFAAFLQKK